MHKLIWLLVGIVGLAVVIGGVGSVSGTMLMPVALGAVGIGLYVGTRKRGSDSGIILVAVVLFALFGFALKSGLIQ